MKKYKVFLRIAACGATALALSGSHALAQGTNVSTTRTDFILGIGAEPVTLTPAITTNQSTGIVGAMIYNGLVSWMADGTLAPELATSWEIAEDGLTYTFKLREGVTWHDGEAFDSADVVFTFNNVLSQFHPRASALIKSLGLVASAPDASTVVFKLEKPYGPLLQRLGAVEAAIVPEHIFGKSADIAADPANQAPIGTGPFMFSSWDRGQTLHLVKNEGFWAEGKPSIQDMYVRVIPEPSNMTIALQTGEIDMISPSWVSTSDIAALQADPALQLSDLPTMVAIQSLWINTARAPLDRVEVRQAIAAALDQEAIVALASDGIGVPSDSALGSAFNWTYDASSGYSALYTPEETQRLKDLLGSEPIELSLTYDNASAATGAIAQVIADQLAEVGIKVRLTELETQVYVSKLFAERDFDLGLTFLTSSGDPAIGYHRIYGTNEGRANYQNPTGYSNPEVDALFTSASEASDKAERGEFYKKATAILNAEVPAVALFESTPLVFSNADLKGDWTYFDSRLGSENYSWAE